MQKKWRNNTLSECAFCLSAKKMKRGFLLLTAVFLLQGCAKIVVPIGGPKDITPPAVIREQPPNGSTDFKAKQIKITFDEYVTLSNPAENVLISPPFSVQPDFILKGKTLILKFKDTLQANTTFNMVFSHLIKDYHEGNSLDYYHYCFSTGDALDSFMVKGTLHDALTLQPQADFFIMLYKQFIDSLPLTTKPDYVTKSLPDGTFSFENIMAGRYKIFALKDINGDLIYNLPNEAIAFDEQPVQAFRKPNLLVDSLQRDSLATKHDSLPTIDLLTFTETDTTPKLLRYENPREGVYYFPYATPFDHFTATPLQNTAEYFQVTTPTSDTIIWYLKNPLKDTLTYLFQADNHIDTVYITPYKAKPNTGWGRRRDVESPKLGITFENSGELYEPLVLKFAYPVRPVRQFDIMVWTQQKSGNDTTFYTASVPNTFTMRLSLPIVFESKKNYSILIRDSVFEGYNRLSHDTLLTSFNTKSEKDYGNLIVNYNVPVPEHSYIVQLWSGTRLIREHTITESQTIEYQHLNPGNYKIKIIYDSNGNHRWDTGNYRAGRQPEPVYFFSRDIFIRAYWDVEEDFVIPE